MKLTALRVKGLRCLRDTGQIKLRPITVLVGKNGSGKSTFARIFPLLRQSLEANTRGPLLWYGQLVDFGDFSTALNAGLEEEEITLEFCLSIPAREANRRIQRNVRFAADYTSAQYNYPDTLLLENLNAIVTIHLQEDARSTYAAEINLKVFAAICTIACSSPSRIASVKINDRTIWKASEDRRALCFPGGLLPRIRFEKRARKSRHSDDGRWELDRPLDAKLTQTIESYVHGNTSRSTIAGIARKLGIGSRPVVFQHLQQIYGPQSWRQTVSSLSPDSPRFLRLLEATMAAYLPTILNLIDQGLIDTFANVRYLEPLRATAQRYYRRQELAVDEVDSTGSNLAMYLDSLSPKESHDFSTWMNEHLNVSVEVHKSGGHIGLRLKYQDSDESVNLADMGFGFSQVLPMAVQLWASTNNRINRAYTPRSSFSWTVVIEQPELHLHPDFQARLANVMSSAIKTSAQGRTGLNLVLETHSPHLINRLGELVARGEISHEDVAVVLFERSPTETPYLRTACFDSHGILENWPFGFFEPGDV